MSASQPLANQVLPFKSSASQKFLKYLKDLADFEPTLIADLANQDENTLIETRNSAKLLGLSEWRIHCAIDAEILSRAKSLSGGRGNVDVEGIGKKAVSSKRAKAIGLTPRTIEKNAQVFALMQTESGVRANAILPDKEFYKVALSAVDPESAIATFAEKKTENRFFKPSDAGRYLESRGLTQKASKDTSLNALRSADRQAEIAHLKSAYRIVVKQILPTAPQRIRELIWDDLLAEITNNLEETDDADATTALIKAWDEGYRREDLMASYTGLQIGLVSRLMKQMEDVDSGQAQFILVPRPGEFKTWHKVGTPLPIELRSGPPKSIDDIRYDRDSDFD